MTTDGIASQPIGFAAIEAAGLDRSMVLPSIEAAYIDSGTTEVKIEAHGFEIEAAGVDRETSRAEIDAADVDDDAGIAVQSSGFAALEAAGMTDTALVACWQVQGSETGFVRGTVA